MIRAAAVAILAGAALAPGGASAATVIGSDLTQASSTPGYCTGDGPGSPCTELQLTLGTADQAVPAEGVITHWAVRDAGGVIALVVIDGPATQRQVVASGPATTVTGTGVQSFPVQIAVHAGQRIGLQLGDTAYVPFFYRDETTTGEEYVPPLGAVPAAPDPGAALARTYEISYNATVEPDADHDGLGDESQDPDHGGAGACPTAGTVARGPDSTIVKQGTHLVACRAGKRTTLGTVGVRTRLRLFRFHDNQLALVKVTRQGSTIQVFDLAAGRRTFSTTRTSNGGSPTLWTVRDLVVASNGDAAWIASLRGHPDRTSVWIRHGNRVQNIDQGRIRPTSLTLADDDSGIYYVGADGKRRNSSFR